jgi:hypothetical protein
MEDLFEAHLPARVCDLATGLADWRKTFVSRGSYGGHFTLEKIAVSNAFGQLYR